MVTLSSTAALTEVTAPSKTTPAPMATDEEELPRVDEDYMLYSKKMYTAF